MHRRLAAQNITEGVIWKQLLSFFFPILLGTFFQQMYNTVDTIIVGRFVGTEALAAVGSTGALISLLNGFFIGLGSGATVLVSQFFGASDHSGVKKALHTGIGLSLVLGILISFFGLCFGPQILQLMKTPADCLEGAVTYARIFFSGAVASMIYNMGSGILRAMGDSKRPMIFLVITCFANIFLDIFCVVVLKMGIAATNGRNKTDWSTAFDYDKTREYLERIFDGASKLTVSTRSHPHTRHRIMAMVNFSQSQLFYRCLGLDPSQYQGLLTDKQLQTMMAYQLKSE